MKGHIREGPFWPLKQGPKFDPEMAPQNQGQNGPTIGLIQPSMRGHFIKDQNGTWVQNE